MLRLDKLKISIFIGLDILHRVTRILQANFKEDLLIAIVKVRYYWLQL